MLWFMRYGLPLLLFGGAFVVLLVAGKANALEGWAMLVGSALALITTNLLFRAGIQGDAERTAEDEARRYFDQHGHWPDEAPRR